MQKLLPPVGIALLLLAGCGSSGKSSGGNTAAPAAGPVKVAYHGIAIVPSDVSVHVGQTITWTNEDETLHNVISTKGVAKIASKDFGKGGTFSYKAGTVGVIHYICSIHPASMVGTITVVK